MKPRLIKAQCLFQKVLSPNELAMREMGITTSEDFDKGDIVFDLNEVSNFNESSAGLTTIQLKNSYLFMIDVPINNFCDIVLKYVGDILEVRAE